MWSRALDLGLTASIFALSVWVYELWNFLVLAGTGAQVYLVLAGPLPAGVVGVSPASQQLIVAKLAQTFLCSATFFGLFLIVRRRDLPLTKLASVCMIGFSLASVQWEFLSTACAFSYIFQATAFMLLAVVFSVLMIRSFYGPAFSDCGSPP
ncbi:MAG: hypothetical protein ABSB26_03505 [Nitrososphaerales archaeon]